MKTSYWFILAFVAIVIVAIVIKRRQAQSEGARMMDEAFEEVAMSPAIDNSSGLSFMSPAIDNGVDLTSIDLDSFGWTVS